MEETGLHLWNALGEAVDLGSDSARQLHRVREASATQEEVHKLLILNSNFDVRIPAFALLVFAVDNLGFRRMHLQAALRQASLKLCFESLRFLLVTAVHQSVICIPTPREVRVCPRHLSRSLFTQLISS